MMNKKLLIFLGSLAGLLTGSAIMFKKEKFPLFTPKIPTVDDKTVLLFQSLNSPYSTKVSMFLDYKGIPYQTVNLLVGVHKHFVKETSGQDLLPFIKYKGQIICDSTNICSYLDERFPNPSLYYEDDNSLNKKVLLLEDWCDESLLPTIRNLMFIYFYENPNMAIEDKLFDIGISLFDKNKERFVPLFLSERMKKHKLSLNDKQTLKKKAREYFDIIADILKDKKFLVGDKLTIADISIASVLTIATKIPYLYEDEVYENLFEWYRDIFHITSGKLK